MPPKRCPTRSWGSGDGLPSIRLGCLALPPGLNTTLTVHISGSGTASAVGPMEPFLLFLALKYVTTGIEMETLIPKDGRKQAPQCRLVQP